MAAYVLLWERSFYIKAWKGKVLFLWCYVHLLFIKAVLDETNSQFSVVQKHREETNASRKSTTTKPKDQIGFKSVAETLKLEEQ